jgi:hypothetical protein
LSGGKAGSARFGSKFTVRHRLAFLFVVALLLLPSAAVCQWKEPPSTGSPENTLPDRTTLAGQSGLAPMISAKLADAGANAKLHKAVVEVQTDGVSMVDPATHQQPKLDEAHIAYQLDGHGPIHSTSKTWTFIDLPAGDHRIRVSLMSNDNHQIGKEQVLKLHVP